MKEIIELKLSSDRSIYVEAELDRTQSEELSASRESKITEKAFDVISRTLSEVAGNLEKHLSELDRGPKKIVVEIHADIRAGGNIFVVNGTAQGGINIQLTWERGA